MAWQNVADDVLEVGDPPAADAISAPFRERDICNAYKPLPYTYDGLSGTGIAYLTGWAVSATFYVYIPPDAPAGALLVWPIALNNTGSSGFPESEVRLKIGSRRSGSVGVSGAGLWQLPNASIALEAADRDTTITLEVEARALHAGDFAQVLAASRFYQAAASIRRP